jgi:hypothetical protein
LSVTYLNPAFVGETVVIDCALKSIGRRLCKLVRFASVPEPVERPILMEVAVTQCVVKQKQSGKLVALAEHGKAALGEQSEGKL